MSELLIFLGGMITGLFIGAALFLRFLRWTSQIGPRF
jgi:hypothetical protein